MPFELSLTFGYGRTSYKENMVGLEKNSVGSFLWRAGPRAYLSENFGLEFLFGQEIESLFSSEDRVTKSQARIGIISRF